MNIGTFVLLTSFLIAILYQAVNFSKVTACRQEAWLKSTELLTHQKMSRTSAKNLFHAKCNIRVSGKKNIIWRELPIGKAQHFNLMLSGKL